MKKLLIVLLLFFSCNFVYSWTYEAYYESITDAEKIINKYEKNSFILKYVLKNKINKAWYLSLKGYFLSNKITYDEELILTSYIEFNNKISKEQNFYKYENKILFCEKILFLIFVLIMFFIFKYFQSNHNKSLDPF